MDAQRTMMGMTGAGMTSAARAASVAMVVALLVAACESAPPAKPTPHPEPGPWQADITYVVDDNGQPRTIHSPLVRGGANDQPTLFIIDSGASEHVFTRALAENAGWTFAPDEGGVDHVDAEVRSWRTVQPITFSIQGRDFTADHAVVFEGPPPFAGWNIGGILSPQTLLADGALVLDFVAQRMSIVEDLSADVRAAVDSRHPKHTAVRLDRVQAPGDEGRFIIVELVDGGRSLPVMLNTGGRHVEFAPGFEPRSTPAEGTLSNRGLSGKKVDSARRTNAQLRVGQTTLQVAEFLVRPQGEAYVGQLGIGVLTGSVLAVPFDGQRPIHWWLPETLR